MTQKIAVDYETHKEATELDFGTFFDVVDNRFRSDVLKKGVSVSTETRNKLDELGFGRRVSYDFVIN